MSGSKILANNRIAELRKAKNLSQAQLAEKTGLTRQAISLYEIGKREPKLETWLKLSDFFNVSVDYLAGKTDLRKKSDITSIVDELSPLVKKSEEETHSDFLKSIDDVVTNKHSFIYEMSMLVVMQSLKSMDDLLNKGYSQSIQTSMLDIFMSMRDILGELNRFSTIDQANVKQLHIATDMFISSLDKKETKNDKEHLKEHLIESIAGLFESGTIPGYQEHQSEDDQTNKKG